MLSDPVIKAIRTVGILFMVTGTCAWAAFAVVQEWTIDLVVLGLGFYVLGRLVDARKRR